MKNNDLSQLRTLDDIARHKDRLRREIAYQQTALENDWLQIKSSWSTLFLVKRGISGLFSFVGPASAWSMFRMGMKLANGFVRLFRKRR